MADLRQQITIDTDTTGVDNLKKALSDILKVSDGLVGTLTLLSKSFSGSASSAEKLDSGFAGTIKKIKSLEDTASTFVNTVTKLGQAQTQEEKVVDKTNKTLAKQREILEGMSRDFTRGESSILATAKASGATNKELKELETTLKQIRTLMGTDPFDNSIGGLRNLENQIKLTRKEYTELRKGSGLTKKDLEDLVRVQEQATVAATREGAQAKLTGKYLKIFVQAAVKDATEKFYELNAALKASEVRNEEYRKKVATSSESLQKRSEILDELAQKERVLQEMQKRGFSKQEAQRFVDLRDSGFKITEAKDIISREKLIADQENLIASAEAVSRGLTRAFNKIKQQQESDAADMMQSAVALFRKQEEEKNKILEQNIAKRKQLQQSAEATVARNTQTKQLIDKGVSSNTASRIVDLKIQGYSASEIRQIIISEKELTAAIDAQKNSLKSRNTEQEKSASSTAKYQQSLEKLKVQLEQVSNGASLTTANGLFLFRKQLQEAGIAAGTTKFAELEKQFLNTRKEIEKATAPTRNLGQALSSLSGPLRVIFPAIGAVTIATLASQATVAFFALADQLKIIESRIKIADGATSDFKGTMSSLLTIANENRKSLLDTANLYAKISPALRKIGLDTEQVLGVTDAFTKTLRISKADTVQASAAILQFSQALASGRLQGDEFRSIAENSPEFLRAMELALGKTAGELRKMSSEGKLTAQVLSGAMLQSLTLLELKSKDIATSIPDAYRVLSNNLSFAAKEIDDRFKVTETIASGILKVADLIAPAFRIIGDALAYTGNAVNSAFSAVKSFYSEYGNALNIIGSLLVGYKVGVAAAAAATYLIPTAVVAARSIYVAAMVGITTAIGVYRAAVALATAGTFSFAGAINAVTAASATNPFGWIAKGLGVIVAGLATVATYLAQDRIAKLLGMDGSNASTGASEIESQLEREEKALSSYFNTLKKVKSGETSAITNLRAETTSAAESEYNQKLKTIRDAEKENRISKQKAEELINRAELVKEQTLAKFEKQFAEGQSILDQSKPTGELDRGLIKELRREEQVIKERIGTIQDVYKRETDLLDKRYEANLINASDYYTELVALESKYNKDTELLFEERRNLIKKTTKGKAQVDALVTLNVVEKDFKDKRNYEIEKDSIEKANKLRQESLQIEKTIRDERARMTDDILAMNERIAQSSIDRIASIELKGTQEARRTYLKLLTEEEAKLNSAKKKLEEYNAEKNGVDSQVYKDLSNEVSARQKNLDLIKASKKELESEAVKKAYTMETEAINNNLLSLKEELKYYGLTEIEKQKAILSEYELAKARGNNSEELEKLIQKQKEYVEALESAKIEKQFKDIYNNVRRGINEAVVNGILNVKGTGAKLRELLQEELLRKPLRIIVQATVDKVFGQIGLPELTSSGGAGALTSTIGKLGNSVLSFGSQTTASGFASQFMSLGDTLSMSDSPEFIKNFGDSLSRNSEMLGKVSAALGAVTTGLAVFDSLKAGQYATAIGQGVGYYFGGAVGSFIGGSIGKVVDKALGFNGGGGAKNEGGFYGSSGSGFTGNGVFNAQAKAVAENTVKQYEELTKALGGQVKKLAVDLFIGTDPSGDANTQLAFGGTVGGQTVFNRSTFGFGYENVGRDNASLEAAINEASLRTVFGALKQTDFADNIDAVIAAVDLRKATLEELNTALSDVNLLRQVNENFTKLGPVMATLVGQSLETVKAFILLGGGVENIARLQTSYIDAIYSDQEKLDLSLANLNSAFEQLGVEVPATAAAYRQLVDSQNLSTVEGQALYLALLQLAPAFKEVKDAQNALQSDLLEEQRQAAEEFQGLVDSYAEVKQRIQDMIYEVSNSSVSEIEKANRDIQRVKSKLSSTTNLEEQIALEDELAGLIFEKYNLEKEQLTSLKEVILDLTSKILEEADRVNEARDSILGIAEIPVKIQDIQVKVAEQQNKVVFNPSAQNLTDEINRFAQSSTVAVDALGNLREQTLKYYEQQKNLADLMKTSASSIRSTISEITLQQQSPAQQVQTLEQQFNALAQKTTTLSGAELANAGTELNSLIKPLLDAASNAYASGPEFQRIKDSILAQAQVVADRIDSVTPVNYQQESLAVLDQIDSILGQMKSQADIATQTLVQAIGLAGEKTVQALNELGRLFNASAAVVQPQTVQQANSVVQNSNTQVTNQSTDNSVVNQNSQTNQVVNSVSNPVISVNVPAIDLSSLVTELRAIKNAVEENDVSIKIVTADEREIVKTTLSELKNRSKNGELVIYADGVK